MKITEKSQRKITAPHPPASWADSSSPWQDVELSLSHWTRPAVTPALSTALLSLHIWLLAPQNSSSAISPKCIIPSPNKHNGFVRTPLLIHQLRSGCPVQSLKTAQFGVSLPPLSPCLLTSVCPKSLQEDEQMALTTSSSCTAPCHRPLGIYLPSHEVELVKEGGETHLNCH